MQTNCFTRQRVVTRRFYTIDGKKHFADNDTGVFPDCKQTIAWVTDF